MANIPKEDKERLPAYVKALQEELKKQGISIQSGSLETALLKSLDAMGGSAANCDQCANGWKW